MGWNMTSHSSWLHQYNNLTYWLTDAKIVGTFLLNPDKAEVLKGDPGSISGNGSLAVLDCLKDQVCTLGRGLLGASTF